VKVLQIIESLTRGGAERLVIELARELTDMGVECRVACLSSPGPWAGELERAGLYAGCLGKRRGVDVACLGSLRTLMSREKPDVVNAHLFTANLWTRLAGIPRRDWALVATLHNIDNWRGPIHRFADRVLAGAADRYIAVGPAVAGYYSGRGIAPRRLSVIANAVHWNGTPCPDPLMGETPVIRACGRLVRAKGFDVLLEAASLLVKRGRRFSLEIIGEGPERPVLEAAANARGLSDVVRFLGARDDARRLIASADVFVLPSRREGLPLVLLEALHAGRPIVASRLSSLDGVVTDGREAVLFDPDDAAALADAIEGIIRNPNGARAMASRARLRAREEFSMRRAALEYAALYEDVMRECRR
jgi:glycosyltransferase involved in cell wall biosynthesis